MPEPSPMPCASPARSARAYIPPLTSAFPPPAPRSVALAIRRLRAVAVVYSMLALARGEGSSAAEALRGVAAAGGLFGIAGYAGKQTGSHRKRERTAYKSTMELAALEPFLANLPDNEKASARRVFAQHFFSQPLE